MHILGKSGKHYRHEPPSRRGMGALEFWAENGMICFVDERYPENDNRHFEVLTVREFLVNLRGVNKSIGRVDYAARVSMASDSGSAGGATAEERESLHRLVENGIRCAKEARSHGDPTNPSHMRDMVLQRRKGMLMAGVNPRDTVGAVSASLAPEGDLLPPLPGYNPKRKLIIP